MSSFLRPRVLLPRVVPFHLLRQGFLVAIWVGLSCGLLSGCWPGAALAQGLTLDTIGGVAIVSAPAPSSVTSPATGVRSRNEGSFKSFGPVGEEALNPKPENPFVGTWKARLTMPKGAGNLVMYVQYMPEGRFRSTSIVEGGSLDGTRMQFWGAYSIRQTDPLHFEMTVTAKGVAPASICVTGGACRPNPIPPVGTETEQILDGASFRSKAKIANGEVTEIVAYRDHLPDEMETAVAETVMLPALTGPVIPPHPLLDDGPEGCNNRQQYRICLVNDGRLTTDKRGCKICVSPDPTKPDQPKPDEPK